MKSIESMVAAKAAEVKGSAPKKRTKPAWVAPTLDDFAPGHVLAFDQTFTNTGFCHLWFNGKVLNVLRKGSIREPPIPELSGQEDTLQRSTWMVERIRNVYVECSNAIMDNGNLIVVHERPAVGGHRIESSLLGGLGVWLACSPRRPVIVSNTHMRAVMTGKPHEPGKAAITEAVNRYTDTKGWNADQRDALALALTYLYDRKRAA